MRRVIIALTFFGGAQVMTINITGIAIDDEILDNSSFERAADTKEQFFKKLDGLIDAIECIRRDAERLLGERRKDGCEPLTASKQVEAKLLGPVFTANVTGERVKRPRGRELLRSLPRLTIVRSSKSAAAHL
jgi:hypothetical protein